MPSQVERLEAHASQLLDSYLGLRERSSMLTPLLFDSDVVAVYGTRGRTRGFNILRSSLFLSCVQDIAKIVADKDPKAPSIKGIAESLNDSHLVQSLRERHSLRVAPLAHEVHDPHVLAALEKLNAQEVEERRSEFDKKLDELRIQCGMFAVDPTVQACRVVRDTVTAHTELRYVVDTYKTTDIAALGLKWSDIGRVTGLLQVPVAAIGHTVRGASFAWEMLDEQLDAAAKGFWTVASGAA